MRTDRTPGCLSRGHQTSPAVAGRFINWQHAARRSMPNRISATVTALMKMRSSPASASQSMTPAFGWGFVHSETTFVSSRKFTGRCRAARLVIPLNMVILEQVPKTFPLPRRGDQRLSDTISSGNASSEPTTASGVKPSASVCVRNARNIAAGPITPPPISA